MVRLVVVCIAVLLLLASPVAAEVPQVGQTYRAGTTIEAPQLSTSFVIPKGWSGAMAPDQSAFVLAKEGSETSILVTAERLDQAQAKAYLAQSYPLGGGLSLVPDGEPKATKDRLTATFSITSAMELPEAQELGARARTRTLKNGVTVIAVSIGKADAVAKLDTTLEAVLKSAKVQKAAKPKTGASSGAWAESLKGMRLNRFHHGSGYSERETVTFCADGRFVRRMDTTSLSQLGSGVYNSANAGRWSATGPLSGGTVTLTFNDGRVSTHRVQINNNQLFVDGTRWLREAHACP